MKSPGCGIALAYVSFRQKRTSPSHFLRNPTFGSIFTTERLLSMPQITGGEKYFLKFLV